MGQLNFCRKVSGQDKKSFGLFFRWCVAGGFGGFPREFQLGEPCLQIGATVLFANQVCLEPICFQIDQQAFAIQFKVNGKKELINRQNRSFVIFGVIGCFKPLYPHALFPGPLKILDGNGPVKGLGGPGFKLVAEPVGGNHVGREIQPGRQQRQHYQQQACYPQHPFKDSTKHKCATIWGRYD